MAKGSARKAVAGDSGDFARYLRLLELYKRDGDWDEYLALAMSPQFQQDLAADAAGPLGVLAFALDQAVRLRRIGDAAALTLAAARWTRRLSVRTASGTGPAAGPDLAGGAGPADEPHGEGAEVELRTGREVLRALLRAWERYDAGNRGAARSLLTAIVRGRPPLIRTSDGARWAVPLLHQALVINPDAAARLLVLVDDNVLGDLGRELTAAGEYGRARIAGAAMRLFFETKADVLADLALTQAEAARKQEAAAAVPPGKPTEPADLRAVTETANLAADAAQQARQEGPGATMAPRTPRVAGRLAKAAAALTLSGENALAARRWAEAMAAAKQDPDPNQTLADFAQAQVRAGLLDDAAQVIAILLDESQASAQDWQANAALDPAWQAAAALVAALAERGDTARAITVLQMIPDFAHSYPRAVRALARAIAATDVTGAERLAGRVNDPDGRGRALAAVATAALAAGHQRDAVRVAGGIEHPRWRAQAFVDLAGAPGQAALIPSGEVRRAIAAVTDVEDSAVLLAEYAVTQDTGERRRLLTKATRLADQAPNEARWRVLTNIGATAAEAGLDADAREAFTAAQRRLAKDTRKWDFELYQLCRARLDVGDTAGARETAAIALGTAVTAPATTATSRRADRPTRQRTPVPDPALDPAIAAAEAVADIPMAVAALAAIACAIGGTAGSAASGSARTISPETAVPDGGDEPGATAAQIERVLAEAERLATRLRGADAIVTDEALTRAYTALGSFAAAERRILSLLPPPDPGDDDADMDEDEDDMDEDDADGAGDEIGLIAVAQERSTALADALVAAGESEHAANFMREVAGRLRSVRVAPRAGRCRHARRTGRYPGPRRGQRGRTDDSGVRGDRGIRDECGVQAARAVRLAHGRRDRHRDGGRGRDERPHPGGRDRAGRLRRGRAGRRRLRTQAMAGPGTHPRGLRADQRQPGATSQARGAARRGAGTDLAAGHRDLRSRCAP